MKDPTAREIVLDRIAQQTARFPELSLEPLDTGGLSERDARLAHAIHDAVLRRWLTLTAAVQSGLSRPWESLDPHVQSALLIGAAQMLLLDRIPAHAAINESVNWIKRHNPKAAGIVNAALRRISELIGDVVELPVEEAAWARGAIILTDGRTRLLRKPALAEDPTTRLSQQSSCPIALLQSWRAEQSDAAMLQLALHCLVQPPIIVTGIDDPEKYSSLTPHDQPGFFVFQGDHDALRSLLETNAGAGARVQDPASAAPVAATASLSPELIIDACAGRGTKTRQLAALHPNARIVATDIDPARRAALRESTANLPAVRVVEPQVLQQFHSAADLLVLDVPCSNTGVLARRVEAKYRFSDSSVQSLVATQRQIIADTLALLADGGRLLYSTCSLQGAENERQIEWITGWHGLKTIDTAQRLPRGAPGDAVIRYSDSSFFAMLIQCK